MWAEIPVLRAFTWESLERDAFSVLFFFHIAAKCILMPNRETVLEVRAKTAPCAINTPLWSTFLCLIQMHFVMRSISRYSNNSKCSMATACIAKGDLDLDYSQLLKWVFSPQGWYAQGRMWLRRGSVDKMQSCRSVNH